MFANHLKGPIKGSEVAGCDVIKHEKYLRPSCLSLPKDFSWQKQSKNMFADNSTVCRNGKADSDSDIKHLKGAQPSKTSSWKENQQSDSCFLWHIHVISYKTELCFQPEGLSLSSFIGKERNTLSSMNISGN